MRKIGNSELERPWRLPALLAAVALLALPAWPFLDRFPSGTFARDTLAFVLAVGSCAILLGLGLGLWIAVRLRTAPALAAGVWSVLVALAWWWWVFRLRCSTGRSGLTGTSAVYFRNSRPTRRTPSRERTPSAAAER